MAEFEIPIYPFFQDCAHRGILPNILLPKNYKELVPEFYAADKFKAINGLVKTMNEFNSDRVLERVPEIILLWDNRLGLKHIKTGSASLDLEDDEFMPSFREHNLGLDSDLYVGAIAMTYIHELLKLNKLTSP